MTDQPQERPTRSYGCSFGCGNPYDYIVVSVSDGTTEFLCLPCYVKLAADMVAAVTSPEADDVKEALANAGTVETAPQTHSKPKSRGKNAPVTTDDDDLLEEFSSVVTVDDLPDDFK